MTIYELILLLGLYFYQTLFSSNLQYLNVMLYTSMWHAVHQRVDLPCFGRIRQQPTPEGRIDLLSYYPTCSWLYLKIKKDISLKWLYTLYDWPFVESDVLQGSPLFLIYVDILYPGSENFYVIKKCYCPVPLLLEKRPYLKTKDSKKFFVILMVVRSGSI